MSTAMTNQDSTKRFLFLSCPRSASHLLMRMINVHEQPNLAVHPDEGDAYFFLAPMFARLGMATYHLSPEEMEKEQKTQLQQAFQRAADNSESFIRKAETNGQSLFVKEHVQIIANPVAQCKLVNGDQSTSEKPWNVNIEGESWISAENPTILPDAYLKKWLPTFLIRHPALVYESMQRALGDFPGDQTGPSPTAHLQLSGDISITRRLYDWYAENIDDKDWPVVVDANDVIREPATVAMYMAMLGFDASTAQTTWSKWTPQQIEALGKLEARMVDTLTASTGVQLEKAPLSIDLDKKKADWIEEFGLERASLLDTLVRKAMPDYEYLHWKRLRPQKRENLMNGNN